MKAEKIYRRELDDLSSYASRAIRDQRRIILLMTTAPLIMSLLVFLTVYKFNTNNFVDAEAPSAPSGKQWNLVFSDEFNDSSLDMNKWEPSWFAGTGISKPVNGNEQSCYDPSLLSEGGGSLTVTAVSRSCSTSSGNYSYASGLINSRQKFTFTYGYFESRMWLAPGTGTIHNWPQFWANGTGTWPTTGEIDVMEGLGGRACYHFHYSGGGPGSCPNLSNQSGWHTFGADWEPGVIKYYYDDQYVGQITSGVTSAPMYLIAALGVSSNISGPVVTPSTMKIDYIRVYQLGAATNPPPTPPPAPTPNPNPPSPTPPPPAPVPVPPPSPPPASSEPPAPVEVPGANPTTPVDIPTTLDTEPDGTAIADFDGDGLNDLVKDSNGDKKIDPVTEIIQSGSTNQSLTKIPSKTTYQDLSDTSIGRDQSGSVVTVKLGPLKEARVSKPVAYTFVAVQAIGVIAAGFYLAVMKLAVFAGLRTRLGL